MTRLPRPSVLSHLSAISRLSAYHTILTHPGALRFSATGLLARLPIAMVSLGIVLLVSATTGSYGLAGSVSAAYVVCVAGIGPMQARLADRLGQHRVLPVVAAGNATALGLLVVVVRAELPTPLPHLCAAVAGATGPVVGSYIRARWTALLRERRGQLHTAYAFEAIVDEVGFMIGPVLVTFLATKVSPYAGVLVAAAAGASGSVLLAVQRGTQPPVVRLDRLDGPRPALGWQVLVPSVTVAIGLGVLFGSADVIVVAIATEVEARSAAGVLLATLAGGSLLAALVTGTIRFRRTPAARLRLASGCLAATVLPLMFADRLWMFGALLFLTGLAISPTLVAAVAVIQQVVPASRVTEGIAWNSAGINGGVAAGGALAGAVIDAYDGRAGLAVPLLAGALAAACAFAVHRTVMRLPDVASTTIAADDAAHACTDATDNTAAQTASDIASSTTPSPER